MIMIRDRTDLISRLSTATGPSRELDWDIALEFGVVTARAVGGRIWYSRPGKPNFLGVLKSDNGGRGSFGPAVTGYRYTESIDAALTLMPEGYGFMIRYHETPVGMRATCSLLANGNGSDTWDVRGITPGIAIVIACLKAKEGSKS